jgi:hypothetical protein
MIDFVQEAVYMHKQWVDSINGNYIVVCKFIRKSKEINHLWQLEYYTHTHTHTHTHSPKPWVYSMNAECYAVCVFNSVTLLSSLYHQHCQKLLNKENQVNLHNFHKCSLKEEILCLVCKWTSEVRSSRVCVSIW